MPNLLLKKITPKTVSESVKSPYNLLAMPRPDGFVPARHLYDLFGVVNRVRQGQTDKGSWVQFKGRFQAVTAPDPTTGEVEVFDSGACHIPGGVVEDLLFSAYDAAKVKAQGSSVSLEIAVRVSIKPAPPDKMTPTGFNYDVQPLVQREAAADDPIARLRAEATKNLLAAPSTSPKTEAVEPTKGGKK